MSSIIKRFRPRLFFPLLLFPYITFADNLTVESLTCEYLPNPLCVDTSRPRLSWKIKAADNKLGRIQTSYRILVASTPEALAEGKADLWDSGTVNSRECAQIEYGAPEESLRSPTGKYYWKVSVTDNYGEVSDWSENGCWGVAPTDWEAQWIGDVPDTALRDYLSYVRLHSSDPDFDRDRWRNPPVLPSPFLRKSFSLGRPVRSAILYASAVGGYEMWLNGKRVGENALAPEWTDYDMRLQFQTYDVTSLLQSGANVVSATLSDGWALGRLAGVKWMESFPHRGFYARDRRLIARLEIEFDNGSRLIVPTDSTWKILQDGSIREADNFGGQTIDARRIPAGWTLPDFDDSSWASVFVDTDVSRNLVSQPNEPIKPYERLKPVRVWWRGDKVMADFGRNITGHCILNLCGDAGSEISVRHGEWLNDDGSLYTQSLGYAKATDRFILSGSDDSFEPTMTYHGFQYIEIDGLRALPDSSSLSAVAISSSAPLAGTFHCSSPDLERLYSNILNTQRNNMIGLITDNPSRDERTGAMGDIQIFAQSSIFNMDMGAFYTKYLHDMNTLASNGQFFSMVPSLRTPGAWDGWVGAPGWCEAAFILPWRLYENYGDTFALSLLYDNMCRHIEATLSENPDLVWRNRHNHNGDWLNANTVTPGIDPTYDTARGATPDDLFATAFFAASARMLSETASVLGHSGDSLRYGHLADEIRARFISEFVHPDGTIDGDSQGAYSLALSFGLVPEELRPVCFANLLRCIEEYDWRLSTGFITTPMMMQTLSDFGRGDVAYRLLTSTRFPSWLYIVRNGATTVWERWDAWIPGKGFQNPAMNSLDHVAFGAVAEWMYRNILGINPDASRPGYEHFFLSPRPGGGLTWAEGSYESIRGTISSSWHTDGESTVYKFTIPVNSCATVSLPLPSGAVISCREASFDSLSDGIATAHLGSGEYTVKVSSAGSAADARDAGEGRIYGENL